MTAYLLGDDRPAVPVARVRVSAPDVGGSQVERLGRVLAATDDVLVYLRQGPGADALSAAAAACRWAGRNAIAVDLAAHVPTPGGNDGLPPLSGPSAQPGSAADAGAAGGPGAPGSVAVGGYGGVGELLRDVLREARLTGAVAVIGPVEAMGDDGLGFAAREAVAGGAGAPAVPPVPVVLYGRRGWNPATGGPWPLVEDVVRLSAAEQEKVWQAELGHPSPSHVAAFRLTARQIRRTVGAARTAARAAGAHHTASDGDTERGGAAGGAAGGEVDGGLLTEAARTQNSIELERLARRIRPEAGWDDLVLPERTAAALRHLVDRAAHRATVLDDWRLRRGGGRGEAVTALFVGESGTGKTTAAEVVAGALGVEMYVIELSSVVDKYVGETEKNLERIFSGAEGLNAVLFFDEADALFGKRSEVSDARDRYANVEVAYLLQRMESFDGVAVLATNLAANLDEAFRRRLSVVAEFARPDAEHRLGMWRRMTAGIPLADDVDLDFCASAFELAGGDIRNAVLTAAFLGAANGQVVHMRELVSAIGLEYRKLGRLCLPDEFGRYFHLLPR